MGHAPSHQDPTPAGREQHLGAETAPLASRFASAAARWGDRARRHAAEGDLSGLLGTAAGGVRQFARRAAPIERLLLRRGRYLHSTRSGALPRYRVPTYVLPPNVEPLDGTRFVVDMDKVTTYCGFSFAPDGWHPLLAALEEHIRDPSLAYEDSILCRFYERFTPATVQDAIFDEPSRSLAPLDVMPAVHRVLRRLWGLDRHAVEQLVAAAPHRPVQDDQSRYFGPKSVAKGSWHLSKVARLYESVSRHGYDPERFGGERPKGYFLVRDGDYRFVIGHAQRRLPALSFAGVQQIVATFQEHVPPVVDEQELARWSIDERGVYPLEVARQLFERLFTTTGMERARVLGFASRGSGISDGSPSGHRLPPPPGR